MERSTFGWIAALPCFELSETDPGDPVICVNYGENDAGFHNDPVTAGSFGENFGLVRGLVGEHGLAADVAHGEDVETRVDICTEMLPFGAKVRPAASGLCSLPLGRRPTASRTTVGWLVQNAIRPSGG